MSRFLCGSRPFRVGGSTSASTGYRGACLRQASARRVPPSLLWRHYQLFSIWQLFVLEFVHSFARIAICVLNEFPVIVLPFTLHQLICRISPPISEMREPDSFVCFFQHSTVRTENFAISYIRRYYLFKCTRDNRVSSIFDKDSDVPSFLRFD